MCKKILKFTKFTKVTKKESLQNSKKAIDLKYLVTFSVLQHYLIPHKTFKITIFLN